MVIVQVSILGNLPFGCERERARETERARERERDRKRDPKEGILNPKT